jgi:general secretion pathway protein G
MVLVLAIIALLIGAGVTHLIGVGTVARIETTGMKLNGLRTAVQLYQLGNGHYPTQEQELRALLEKSTQAPVPKRWVSQLKSEDSLVDPWGNPIQYRVPISSGEDYDVFSWGKDGVENENDIC